MAVDTDFYYNIFGGTEQSDLDALLARAENEISCLILREPETESEIRLFSLAVCAQAEYMGMCGGVEAWAVSSTGTARSFTIGSFSMSGGTSSDSSSSAEASGICSRTVNYLDKAGLLYRGCEVWQR